jgi:hypothetical protein
LQIKIGVVLVEEWPPQNYFLIIINSFDIKVANFILIIGVVEDLALVEQQPAI